VIDAIYEIGTLARVLQLLKLPDGTVKGTGRGRSARESGETTTTAAAVPEEAPVEEEASTLTAH
jgi:hypothetical protein